MWLTETAWPLILIFSILGVLCLAGWQAQGRKLYFVGLLVMVLLAGATYWTEAVIVTETERVEQAVYGLVATFQEESQLYGATSLPSADTPLRTLEFISTNAADIQNMARGAMLMVSVGDDMRLTDLQIDMRSNNSRAITHFRVNATVDISAFGISQRQPSRWEVTWQREGGEWKVIRVDRLNVVTGERIDFRASERN